MYAQEMRNSQGRKKSLEEGSGDASLSKRRIPRDVTPPSAAEADDFLFGFGHYGDPHAFAPYQLILLFVDFAFNWSMDLAHEYPLAVLVIFVFQSLGMIINLILYIMASANQAMQSGIHKRVTTHHWINLVINLVYMALTAWLFIWALRNSWPSVSDEFSFTWPAAGPSPSSPPEPLKAANSTRRSTVRRNAEGSNEVHPPIKTDIIKEHYTIWSNGFIALYVCHRTLAIIYYVVYLRATFLVLNTSAIDWFVESKRNLVDNINGKSRSDNMRGVYTASLESTSEEYFKQPPFALGLDEYLGDGSKFMMEKESGLSQPSESLATEPKKKHKPKRQIIWADNETENGRRDETDVPKQSQSRRKQNQEDTEDDNQKIYQDKTRTRDKPKHKYHSRRGQDEDG